VDFPGAPPIVMDAPGVSSGDVPLCGIPGAFARQVEALPDTIPGAGKIGMLQHTGHALLFEVPSVARYRISGGNLIEFAPARDADAGAVELFLHNSARGYLLHQRGELPLASTTLISPDFTGVAICGPSAFGKSTLAAALGRRGWKLLADGVTRVTGNAMAASAWPSDTHLGLWRDACVRLQVNLHGAVLARKGLQKFLVPMPATTEPFALAAIIGLRITPEARLVAVPPSGAPAMILEQSFRHRQLVGLGFGASHAGAVQAVAPHCRCFWLDGARRADVSTLADLVESATR
jgi:hypothetical protein